MGRAGGLEKFKERSNVRVGHGGVCVVDVGKGMRLAKFSIVVGGGGDWEMGGASVSTGGHGSVNRAEDLTDDEAGSKSR